MPKQAYTTDEVAEILGVSVRRIQALINTGFLEANKTGRDWIIPEEEVERFKQKDRQAGRPSRKKPEVERAFLDRPSGAYIQVVETIRILIEKEGIETAYRAFAEAAWRDIRARVMDGFKLKGLAHVCVHRLLGKKRCPDSFEHPCDSPNIPGQDHLSEWVQDGITTKIVLQPYNLSYETMQELVKYCDEKGLRVDVSAESWHFPGRTLRVDLTQNKK